MEFISTRAETVVMGELCFIAEDRRTELRSMYIEKRWFTNIVLLVTKLQISSCTMDFDWHVFVNGKHKLEM